MIDIYLIVERNSTISLDITIEGKITDKDINDLLIDNSISSAVDEVLEGFSTTAKSKVEDIYPNGVVIKIKNFPSSTSIQTVKKEICDICENKEVILEKYRQENPELFI